MFVYNYGSLLIYYISSVGPQKCDPNMLNVIERTSTVVNTSMNLNICYTLGKVFD